MKQYAKIDNGVFDGFYRPDIQETMFEMDGENVKPLFEYVELTQEEYDTLFENLYNTEDGMFVYEEGKLIVKQRVTPRETLLELYDNRIGDMKDVIREQGMKVDVEGISYRQRVRKTDISDMHNKIQTLTLKGSDSCIWYFQDTPVTITKDKLVQILCDADTFVDNLFSVEEKLKKKDPNLKLKLSEFMDEVDALSLIKCYR